jgi:hypothetical protein
MLDVERERERYERTALIAGEQDAGRLFGLEHAEGVAGLDGNLQPQRGVAALRPAEQIHRDGDLDRTHARVPQVPAASSPCCGNP